MVCRHRTVGHVALAVALALPGIATAEGPVAEHQEKWRAVTESGGATNDPDAVRDGAEADERAAEEPAPPSREDAAGEDGDEAG